MSSSAPAPTTVLEVFDALDSPGTPLTTSEVADEFDCTSRTIYNKLDALTDDGSLETKKVGARGRVWWRPPRDHDRGNGHDPGFTLEENADHTQDDAELRESEERYRTLFESIDEGFCTFEVLFDEESEGSDEASGGSGGVADQSVPVDYRFIETNSAFEEITGLTDAEGKRMRELEPDHEEHWFETYGRVALTGEPERFTDRAEHLGDRWYDLYAFRIGEPEERTVAVLFDDITERKEREEALRESEEFSRRIFDSSPDCIKTLDTDGRLLSMNAGGQCALEIEDLAPFLNEPWADFSEREGDRETARAAVESAVAGDTDRFTAYCPTMSGKPRWWDVTVTPILDAQGQPERLLAISRDITERKQKTRALEEREQKLQETRTQLEVATNAASVGTFTVYLQEDVSTGDAYLADVFGMNADRIATGAPIDEFFAAVHDNDREQVWDAFNTAEETGDLEVEYRVRNADDELIWVVTRGTVEYDDEGEPLRVHGAISDITERKEREEALRRSEERLRLATDVAEIGVWELDLQTESSPERSPQHDEIFGYEEPREDWSLETFLDHVHPDDRDHVEESFEDAFQTGDWTFECRIVRVDDEQRWVSAQGEFYDDDEGEPVRAVGTVEDITERKETKTELREREERQNFLVELNDALQSLADTDEILNETYRLLAERLDVDRAYFVEVDEEAGHAFVEQDFVRGETPSLEGDHPIEDFGWAVKILRQGEHYAINDTQASERVPEADRAASAQLQIIACIGTPLIKDDQLEGALCVTDSQVREWTDREVDLLREVAERTWSAVERARAETELREREEQLRSLKDRLLETSPTGILLVNGAGEITLANDRAEEILERSVEELTGLPHNAPEFDFVDPNGEPIPDAELPFERVRRTGEAVFGIEVGVERPDGKRVWVSVNATPLYDDHSDEPTETVVALEDITDRKRATDALEHLNDVSRELMGADTQEISDRVAGIAREVLDVEYASYWRYDDSAGDLQLQTASTDPGRELESICYPEGFEERAWQTFVSDEMDVSNDLPPAPEIAPSEESIRSGVIVPLGRHGIVCAGSIYTDEFDETTVDLAETVAKNVEAALNRAEYERQMERQTDELKHLDRINTIIREIDRGVVQADTREEIESIVCERLAASDLYEFAWIGEHDVTTGTVEPREWAGVDSAYLDDLTITTDDTPTGRGPVGTAVRTQERQVVEDIVTDARFTPWREQTLKHGVRSCTSIPVAYDGSLYGILTVYAEHPQHDERDHLVLEELGETLAHAINAIETKDTLRTDSVVELELRVPEPDTPLWRLAQRAECRIEFEGFVPQADENSIVFFTADCASPDDLSAIVEQTIAIEGLTCLNEREADAQFKAVCSDPTLSSQLVEHKAMVRTLTIDGEGDGATAVVDLPSSAAVRDFIERIQTTHPHTELLARRTRDRTMQTPGEFRTAFEDRLTPRQREVLQTAYLSGFFQSPRESTGKEVAETLGVSQPTFTEHLRAGQHSIFNLLFDEASRRQTATGVQERRQRERRIRPVARQCVGWARLIGGRPQQVSGKLTRKRALYFPRRRTQPPLPPPLSVNVGKGQGGASHISAGQAASESWSQSWKRIYPQ